MTSAIPSYPPVMHPFHLAFPVTSLSEARTFYGELLGCPEGRSSEDWVDFNLCGHQIVAHKVSAFSAEEGGSDVDGHLVPVRHFGLVLPTEEWEALVCRLDERGVSYLIKPCLRFEGTPGAQQTLFLRDPSGNALEFKSMLNPKALFTRFDEQC